MQCAGVAVGYLSLRAQEHSGASGREIVSGTHFSAAAWRAWEQALCFYLMSPRHISTLHFPDLAVLVRYVRC
jgi:hypothetical protein